MLVSEQFVIWQKCIEWLNVPMFSAFLGSERLYCVRTLKASMRISTRLLIKANSGPRGNDTANMVTKPYCMTISRYSSKSVKLSQLIKWKSLSYQIVFRLLLNNQAIRLQYIYIYLKVTFSHLASSVYEILTLKWRLYLFWIRLFVIHIKECKEVLWFFNARF